MSCRASYFKQPRVQPEISSIKSPVQPGGPVGNRLLASACSPVTMYNHPSPCRADHVHFACREKDPDPDGEQLAATQDPLGEAMKLVQRLRQHSGDRLGTHKLACDVYLRRHRLLLALKAVNNAIALAGASHPDVHGMVVRTCSAAQAPSPQTPSPETDGTSKPQQVGNACLPDSCPDMLSSGSLPPAIIVCSVDFPSIEFPC